MILPHNKESEEQVIGSLLMADDIETDEIYSLLSEDDFYVSRYRKIFAACKELRSNMEIIDLVSVSNLLGGKISSFELGEIQYKVISTANADFHAKLVKDFSDKRKLIKMAMQTIESANDQNLTAGEIIAENDAALFSIASSNFDKNIYDIKTLATNGIERVGKAMREGCHITGVPCGFRDIDGLMFGFQKKNMIILAARPSVGKTALALNFAINMSLSNHPVGFFSLEMSADELWNRLISSKERIDSSKLISGAIDEREYKRIINSAVNNSKLIIDDSSGITVSAIRSRARVMVKKQKVEMIFVDYIGLVAADGRHFNSRNLELGYISAQLKNLAKELNIPIMVLSQLSRESTRLQIPPRLIDLRESGNIEQDADIVIFIHRPEQHGIQKLTDGVTDSAGMAEIYFAKFRNGKTGMIPMRWAGEYGQFSGIDHLHEVPY